MPESMLGDIHLVYLGLGSNISPETNLPSALKRLRDTLQVEAVSTAWKTPAIGTVGPDFLNAAIAIRTELSPDELKSQVIRKIENQLGRIRTEDKNAPRSIDIDILIFNEQIVDPQIWSQVHLAVPLAELIPGFMHSESGETLAQAARRLSIASPITPQSDVFAD